YDDLDVRLVEGQVVVAAVPDDDVGLTLRLLQDGAVIDAGIDDRAVLEVRLVFLAFFDGALVPVEVLEGGEALHALLHEIAVGHRVTHRHDAPPLVEELPADAARRLALARAGAHRAHRHDRL